MHLSGVLAMGIICRAILYALATRFTSSEHTVDDRQYQCLYTDGTSDTRF